VKAIGWRLWYVGGATFDHHSGSWADAPYDGVLEMMVYYDQQDGQGRPCRLGLAGDWYFSDGDQLFGCNDDTLEENRQRYPQACFKRGRWAESAEYHATHKRASEDYEV